SCFKLTVDMEDVKIYFLCVPTQEAGRSCFTRTIYTNPAHFLCPTVHPLVLHLSLYLYQRRHSYDVLFEGRRRLFACIAGLLETAEWRGHVAAVVLVYPDAAGAQGLCRQVRLGKVGCPHGGGEPVRAVVGNSDSLIRGVEGNDPKDRAEDFFLGDLHC